jgi:ketosteroid isomerase-like protein
MIMNGSSQHTLQLPGCRESIQENRLDDGASKYAQRSTRWNRSGIRLGHEERRLELPDNVELLKRIYDRFNARDMETVLAALHQDVTWANGMEGGYVHGREGVRSYWKRQWAMVDPHVEPVTFAEGTKAEVIVEVHQVVRDLKGNLLADKMVGHIFRVENGLVSRFDIRAT